MVRITVLPKTSLGKWSVGLVATFILFFVLFVILVASGQRGGETFFSNLLLTAPMLLAGTCGVAAFVTGLIGIIKSKERSILVYLAIFIGFDILVFCLGEFLVPH
jgi:predicted Abi (CAAX) family protease